MNILFYLKRKPSLCWKVRIACILVLISAVGSLAGHASHQALLYTWGGTLGMGLPTAICLILLSLSLLLIVPDHE